MKSTFDFHLVFLSKEDRVAYVWALQQLLYMLGFEPEVLVTERDLALAGTLHELFVGNAHIMCIWNVDKNVVSNNRKHFEMIEEFLRLNDCTILGGVGRVAKRTVRYHKSLNIWGKHGSLIKSNSYMRGPMMCNIFGTRRLQQSIILTWR